MSILLSDYESHIMKLFVHIYYSFVALTTNGSDIKVFSLSVFRQLQVVLSYHLKHNVCLLQHAQTSECV